jgi:hypothetical protein
MFLPKILSCTTLLLLGSLLAAFALLTSVTGSVAMAQDKVIRKAPVGQSDPSSGKAMYASYCGRVTAPPARAMARPRMNSKSRRRT